MQIHIANQYIINTSIYIVQDQGLFLRKQEQEVGIHPVMDHRSTAGHHAYRYSRTHSCLGAI